MKGSYIKWDLIAMFRPIVEAYDDLIEHWNDRNKMYGPRLGDAALFKRIEKLSREIKEFGTEEALKRYEKENTGPKNDIFGNTWYLPKGELCSVCGQPDNTGDCNHEQLEDDEVLELGGHLYVGR